MPVSPPLTFHLFHLTILLLLLQHVYKCILQKHINPKRLFLDLKILLIPEVFVKTVN